MELFRDKSAWKNLWRNKKKMKNMEGLVKTLGILLFVLGVALWAAVIFFVPAALIKYCWLYLFA